MSAVLKETQDFHIADISLAAWGEKEIRIAERLGTAPYRRALG